MNATAPKTPRFTVVLPTHNRADVLPFSIRSALWQTMPDFELLIAGDGCTDGTREVVRSFDDPRIRWFDLPKAPGIGYANRNAVLREARGRDIAYLAHDDIWFPDHLERLGALLDRSGVEYAYTRGLGVDIEGRMLPYWFNLSVARHQAGLWRGDSAITMCTVAHSRACLDKYGYWDETMSFGADVVMWHRILMGGRFKNLAFDPNPTSLHFVANWRDTKAHRRHSWIAGRLLDDFVNEMVPDPLRLRARPDRTQQEAAWLWLARNPTALVGEIRDGVVQLSDTMLWRSRTQPRLVGLRAGLMLGSVLERCRNAAMWMASPARRRLYANVRNKTRALQRAGVAAGVADRTAGIGGMEHERDIFDRSSGPDHRGLVAGQDAGRGSSRSADGHP
jgi:glycosyltransferase involved in cell wall biosynthesis